MFFRNLVMRIRGLMGCQSTTPFTDTDHQQLHNVSNSLAKYGQHCKDAQAPVSQKSKGKSSVVQQDTQVKLRKKTQKTVQKHGRAGSQQATPAEKSHQGLSNKRSVASQTTQAQSSSKERTTTKPKATPRGKTSATLASQTHRHAKSAKKPKH